MQPTKKEIIAASAINVGEREEVPQFKRDAYEEVWHILKRSALNVSITGLRRVGKTTLIKQLLNEWPDKAFYFSFDEPRYQNYETLKHVIETFITEADKPLIALDEVGKIKEWAGLIKKYYDQGKARFIISGSSSLNISKGKESLAGREFEVRLPPLQYNEFISYAYGERPLMEFGEIFRRNIKNRLPLFLRQGSFPETARMDADLAARYIADSVVSKITFEDIPTVFRIEYRAKLHELLHYMVEYSGNLLYENAVANLLGINKTTVKEYIFYLEQTFLAYLIYTEGAFTKRLRKTKKAYVACPSIYTALSSTYSDGVAAEVAVFDKLLAMGEKPFFYRDAQQREVDFIFRSVPIEVKFRNQVSHQELRHLLYYMERREKDVGIVITKDYLDEQQIKGRRIIFVPLHLFLAVTSFKDFPA